MLKRPSSKPCRLEQHIQQFLATRGPAALAYAVARIMHDHAVFVLQGNAPSGNVHTAQLSVWIRLFIR